MTTAERLVEALNARKMTCGTEESCTGGGLGYAITAAAALAQIKAKGYAEKWLRCGKKVTLVGAALDAGMRNLSDRQIEVESEPQ